MKRTASLLVLLAALAVSSPAEAQLRADLGARQAQTRLYDAGGAGWLLNTVFNPLHFSMGHSVSMTFGGGGSLGMYTNSLMWNFDKLAARADVSVAYSPFGEGSALSSGDFGQRPQVFLQNAEVAYRPTENLRFHLSFQQSPFGYYASPYGYRPYRRLPVNP